MISIITIVSVIYYAPKMKTVVAAETTAKPIDVTPLAATPVVKPFDPTIHGNLEIPDSADSIDPDDLKSATKTAPEGLEIANLFELGQFEGNQAEIINNNSSGKGGSLLQVTNNTKQLGAIWGNIDQGNYIDVSKDQTLSMWLYFGRKSPKLPKAGDGMAFVLQNDDRGAGAIATYHRGQKDESLGYGESLGVWATDFDPSLNLDPNGNWDKLLSTAIQKSFAIEFDTFADYGRNYDQITGEGTSFDNDFDDNYQHIAMKYPDSKETYRKGSDGNVYYYIMNHTDYANDYPNQMITKSSSSFLTDQSWHHVTIDWKKNKDSTGNLTLKFNDKSIQGLPQKGDTLTKKINISHFGLQNGDTRLRWGFTGSTGRYSENNLISFESVPSFVNGDVYTDLYNETTKNYLNSDYSDPNEKNQHSDSNNPNNNVKTGDTLNLIYKMRYKSGIMPWKNTVAHINLPDHLSAYAADVAYADNTHETYIVDGGTKKLDLTLHNPLKDQDPTNPTAVITVHGIVDAVENDTKVPSVHSRFQSEYLIKDVESPWFNIQTDDLNLVLNKPKSSTYDSYASVPDQVPITYNTWLKNSYGQSEPIVVHYSMNGNKKEETLYDSSPMVFHTLKIPKEWFNHLGDSRLSVYATSGDLKSETRIIDFSIGEHLSVSATDLSFGPLNGTNNKQFDKRDGNWSVKIVDTRKKDSPWFLQAVASPLIDSNSNKKFNGEIVYRNDDGSYKSLSSTQLIASGKKETDEQQSTTDIVKSWNSDQGILLKSNGNNETGKYKGTISWTLTDSLKK
jgi:hypothetical protein